jgi:hypothetical protein
MKRTLIAAAVLSPAFAVPAFSVDGTQPLIFYGTAAGRSILFRNNFTNPIDILHTYLYN